MQRTNASQTSQNFYQKTILSAYCLVMSNSVVGFSSGQGNFSLAPAHFTLYRDFVRLKLLTYSMTCQREHTVFIERAGWLRKRLFIRLGTLDDAIEIIGRNRKILAALKCAGYDVQSQQ